jgi:hypothetical protein
MIPDRFRKVEEPPIPAVLKPYFERYEAGQMPDETLAAFLREWVKERYVEPALRKKLDRIQKELQKDVDARHLCGAETGIMAVPPRKGKKFS